MTYSICLSLTEQQASSASSLHFPYRCVLQRCEERYGQHCLPGTQDPPRLFAQVLKHINTQGMGGREEKEQGKSEGRREEKRPMEPMNNKLIE